MKQIKVQTESGTIVASGRKAKELWRALREACFADRLLPDGRVEMHILTRTGEQVVRIVEVR